MNNHNFGAKFPSPLSPIESPPTIVQQSSGMVPLVISAPVVSTESVFHQLCNDWQGIPFAELSVLLSWTKALAHLHQAHHWQSMGDPFYGDHLLYDRLHAAVSSETDVIGEKAVGVGCTELIDPKTVLKNMVEIVDSLYLERPGIPQPNDLCQKSLDLELGYLKVLDLCKKHLEHGQRLTQGVENMLNDIYDKHEGHVYLLKQRCK